MFTFEIRINGSLIGHIYGHNESRRDAAGRTEYSYEYYEVESRKIIKGTVYYLPQDGIRPLGAKILNDVDER